jgi:DNA helicase HerA-like ATPase
MFDLLRRARAGGLGVFLATQNPGDLDYRARDNISTWLIGRVGQPRAIEKMRNLLGAYPDVAGRLATQTTGSFFLINPDLSRVARELRADPALMRTEQLQEQEIAELARATAPSRPGPGA